MSILKFAEEFTRLIIRYTRTSSPNNDPLNTIKSLTDEEIVYTIHHVLQAISIKGFNKDKKNLSDISHNANVTTIPETLTSIKYESNTEDRSPDVQSVCTDDDSCISEISSKASKQGYENSFNESQNEKKLILQSNPAICINNNISRSDTFIREESPKNIEDQDDVFEDFPNIETDDSNNFQVSLSEIRKSAMDLMEKLNNLELSFLQSPKKVTAKIRHLSLTNGRSSPHCTSITNTAKVSTNTRKSSSAFSKTLISSKLLVKNENTFERRKSTGGIGINVPVGKSGEPKVTSNMTLSTCNKTSPGLSVEFQPKFTKNPKYAHVRSTIPKAIINQKKKTQ